MVSGTAAGASTPYDPEFAWGYEIGAKTDWLDRRLVDLTPDMVAARHKRRLKDSPAGADRAMRVLRVVWNHAREIAPRLPENPVRRLTATRFWSRVGRRRSG